MKRYPWLSYHFRKLITHYHTGSGHHALLIHALPGMGTDELIYAIIQFLMCQDLDTKKYSGCSKCSSCLLIEAQSHPDYCILKSETDKDVIGIEEIREISEKVNKCPRLEGNKVVWIKNATKLTEAATNALLKTLEEPLEKTYFFLSCYDPFKLLPTLRSRCRIYYLNTPNENWTINWLVNKVESFPETRISALRLSEGAPLAALSLLQPKIWSQREQLCGLLSLVLSTENWIALFEILNHEKVSQRLYWLGSLLLDAIKLQVGVKLINNVDVYPLLKDLTNRFPNYIMQTILHEI